MTLYSRWDGTQNPLGDSVDVAAALDAMSDELLSGYGMRWSLNELRRRGFGGSMGLDEMVNRLRARRQRIEQDTDLAGPLEHVRRELEGILDQERETLSTDPSLRARTKEALLAALPRNPAEAIRELRSYEFASAEAARRFEELVRSLQQEVLNAYFRQMAGAMKDLSPDDIAALKEMLAELNDMIEADRRGDPYDFDGFMQRHGRFFADNPATLNDLLEGMARRMAAMSRLLASLSPDQRRALADLAAAVLDDLDLAWQVDQLGRNLRERLPGLPWDEGLPGGGEGEMPLSMTVDALEELSELEDLEHALAADYPGASLEDVDEETLQRALGTEALRDLRWLKELEKALERAGLARLEKGMLTLTPRGARVIGERSLTKILENTRREPTHRARGYDAEPTGQTRPWQFGDSDPISVERTIYNAVVRAGPGRKVSLAAEDFELEETETRPRSATALLLDLSMSMPLRGHWLPAKRMALALHALMDSKYPQDSLYLIGFSTYARRMQPAELATEGWGEEQGTNMEHAFLLAHRLLAEDPRGIRQVLMVTDGEPTAHLEDGYAAFNWPPARKTIEKTLRESVRLARSNISINVFMVEEAPGLITFMERLARLTGGHVYRTPSTRIGDHVIGTYLEGRRRRAS